MKWNESTSGGILLCQTRVSDVEANVVAELWLKFFTLFVGASPGKWNAIKVEIWADSGRIIIFPGAAGKADRDEEFCLEVYVASLFDFFEQLSDSDIDDDAFDDQVSGHVRGLIDRLSDGLGNTLKNDSTLRFSQKVTVEYSDGEESIVQKSV